MWNAYEMHEKRKRGAKERGRETLNASVKRALIAAVIRSDVKVASSCGAQEHAETIPSAACC